MFDVNIFVEIQNVAPKSDSRQEEGAVLRPEIGGTDLSRHGSSKLQLFLGEIKANVGRSA